MLGYILRSEPGSIGLTLDPQGRPPVDDILQQSKQPMPRGQIRKVVIQSDKQRFAQADGVPRSRTNQGYSFAGILAFAVDLGAAPQNPARCPVSRHQRSKPADHQPTKLSCARNVSMFTCLRTPKRRARLAPRSGKPVMLIISGGEMFLDNCVFHQSQNGARRDPTCDAETPQAAAKSVPLKEPTPVQHHKQQHHK